MCGFHDSNNGPSDGSPTRISLWGGRTESLSQTSITGILTAEQLDAYVLYFCIQDLTEKLRLNRVIPESPARSPSPTPEYDSFGRRTNTREMRYRERAEAERAKLIEEALRTIPDYQPPADFKRNAKIQQKVFMPVKEHQNINFVGQLLGPRGRTLQRMESESGAKISIRGKGSIKDGKGKELRKDDSEEDLHCIITADTEESMRKAMDSINKIVSAAISMPEHANELKRGQLRELAALNGTLRDDESAICLNCGEVGHRKYNCPKRTNITNSIICRNCAGVGHFARDCKIPPKNMNKRDAEKKYDALITELRQEPGRADANDINDTDLVHKLPYNVRKKNQCEIVVQAEANPGESNVDSNAASCKHSTTTPGKASPTSSDRRIVSLPPGLKSLLPDALPILNMQTKLPPPPGLADILQPSSVAPQNLNRIPPPAPPPPPPI